MIPHGRQSITDEDIEAVVAVLKSDYLTQGEAVPAFEQGLADYRQAPHVIACSNGTTALHLCLRPRWRWANRIGSGYPPSVSSPPPTVPAIAAPRWISSTWTPQPATSA